MDAQRLRLSAGLAVLGILTLAAARAPAQSTSGYQCTSPHFVVTAPTAGLAREIAAAAERYRRDLAIEWLGHELNEWQGPCTIQVHVGSHLGAGGATSFAFVNRQPVDFRMTIQGSHARLLDSVLPHEITHTIFATHFGRPLPRWADEGAATSVEHISERSKQDQLLIEFLTTDRGIAFNRMFAMRDYPKDILPLYAQGYSLAKFLIAQGGRKKFLQYVGDGMNSGDWPTATATHYGFADISALQLTWLDWVRQGSPMDAARWRGTTATIAANGNRSTIQPAGFTAPSPTPPAGSFRGLVPLPTALGAPPRAAVATTGQASSAAARVTQAPGSWYLRQRDSKATLPEADRSRGPAATTTETRQTARPQPTGRPQPTVLQWSSLGPPQPAVMR